MDVIKSSPEAVITFGVIEALGAISPQLARTMIDFFSAKGMGVTTNVPGPAGERYFAGVPVTSVLGGPSAGIQTLNECIFSFDGTIRWASRQTARMSPTRHGSGGRVDTGAEGGGGRRRGAAYRSPPPAPAVGAAPPVAGEKRRSATGRG